eukprot:715437-Alexandrium_andersonii.AAC.1
MRLCDLEEWIQSWLDPDMHGGFRGRSAPEASWALACQLELCKSASVPMSMLAIDVHKCFDQ